MVNRQAEHRDQDSRCLLPRVRPAMPVVEMIPPVVAQAKRMRRVVEISPRRAGIRPGGLRPRIHARRPHLPHVDHQTAVIRPESRPAVPTASHRQIQTVLGRAPHGRHHVANLLRPQHSERSLVEHPVVHCKRASS